MLSKSQISFIKSLHQKKCRKEQGLFIIEGTKSLIEFIDSPYQIHSVYTEPECLATLPDFHANIKLFEINHAELEKISTLQTPQGVLAIVKIPENRQITHFECRQQFTLVLDEVQDPGNLGTIIRTADWFGISQVLCSTNTVDVYNPKTVQSTMGSLARVSVHYTYLPDFLKNCPIPVYGALLSGTSVYENNWGNEGIILLGNEGHGISKALQQLITTPLTIPRIGNAESLNVAVSAAIFCSEIGRYRLRRQIVNN